LFETLTQRLTASFSALRGGKSLSEEQLDLGLAEVRRALLEADVHIQVTRRLTASVRDRLVGEERVAGVDPSQQFAHAFHAELVEIMGPEDARLSFAKSGPTVILMAGLQGAGKTTTCAKLARWLRDEHQRRPLMVAADVKRPAAVEQLQILGRKIDVPVFHLEGATPPDVCRAGVEHARAISADVVLLDTAGRLHVDDDLMAEVAEIARVTKPDDQVLVVDAMTGQDAVSSAGAFHSRLELTGVVLTKLDGDARGGAALSLKAVTGCPILFIGTGEKIEDIDAFHPDRMAGRILGMGDVVGLVEKAQEQITEKEAQVSFERMVMGSFTLEDMLSQLRMIRRMGPMKKVLGMMPGMSGQLDQLDVDDGQMNRLEALFTSMTPRERVQPDVIDMSRRRRIARGAGQDVGAINDLLKRFRGMKKMMKQMGKLGLGSKMGAGAKRDTLRDLSPSGELAGGGGGGGLLGGLGGLFGGGGGSPGAAGSGELAEALGGGGARPMGSSATRKSAPKRRKRDRRSRKGRKGKRK
jgi:signal recognition particle subunit SRP54